MAEGEGVEWNGVPEGPGRLEAEAEAEAAGINASPGRLKIGIRDSGIGSARKGEPQNEEKKAEKKEIGKPTAPVGMVPQTPRPAIPLPRIRTLVTETLTPVVTLNFQP